MNWILFGGLNPHLVSLGIILNLDTIGENSIIGVKHVTFREMVGCWCLVGVGVGQKVSISIFEKDHCNWIILDRYLHGKKCHPSRIHFSHHSEYECGIKLSTLYL